MTVTVTESSSHFLPLFEQGAAKRGVEPRWLEDRRRLAMERFSTLGIPTTREEDYKYTNLAPVAKTAFSLAGRQKAPLHHDELAPVEFPGLKASRLVFVNGLLQPELSELERLPADIVIAGIADMLRRDPGALAGHLTRYADPENHALTALNTALFEDGAYIEVPEGLALKRPVHLVFVSVPGAGPTISFPRVLIVAGRSAQVTVMESYIGAGAEAYWTNAVTEIVAEENARVDHYRLQLEQPQAFHTGLVQGIEERNSYLGSFSLSYGGKLVRNDINTVLDDEGGECSLDGLYAISGEQHVDHHTKIDHAKPHCNSHQLYKGILDGKARAVFNGKIIVRAGAAKTDAIQHNKNLLLSRDCDVNTKPQLEIFNNDVRCTHGATIGQLDRDAAFYLQTRGIGAEQARNLLTYAFAADSLERIQIEPVREYFENRLLEAYSRREREEKGAQE